MCYMVHMRRIGVRELRQHASEHLRRVRAGETVEITERGRPVAMLVPLGTETGRLDLLTLQGRLGADLGDVLELGAPLAAAGDRATPSEELRRMRDDER